MRRLLLAYAALTTAVIAVMLWRWPHPPSHVERMQAIHAYVDQTVPDGSALFLGDSHTQRLAVAAVDDRAVNFGIGWQTAAELRVPASVKRVRVVYLLIGTNDVLRGDDPLPSIRRIVDEIPAPLVLTGIPPINGKPYDNAPIRALCVNRCTYVEPPTDMLADGVHFSPVGYADWIKRLRAARPLPASP